MIVSKATLWLHRDPNQKKILSKNAKRVLCTLGALKEDPQKWENFLKETKCSSKTELQKDLDLLDE